MRKNYIFSKQFFLPLPTQDWIQKKNKTKICRLKKKEKRILPVKVK